MEDALTWLAQSDIHRWIRKLESADRIPIYKLVDKADLSERLAVYSALIPVKMVAKSLRWAEWDLKIGGGSPGFISYYRNGKESVKYFRYGNDMGIEPTVVQQEFFGLKPKQISISEELRLLFGLYQNTGETEVRVTDDDGNDSVIGNVTASHIELSRGVLGRFSAAKQMALALYFGVTRGSSIEINEAQERELSFEKKDDVLRMSFALRRADDMAPFRSYSRTLGKLIFLPEPRERCGVPPFQVERPPCLDFIIGADGLGRPVYHTSDPDQLDTPAAGKSGGIGYLTPVYFRREVLDKYYSFPSRFSVEDSYIRCGYLWGLTIDNNAEGYVIAWLGDLGRELPTSEQYYWKSFNVVPAAAISRTFVRRQLMGKFTEASAVDLAFKVRYSQFQDTERERGDGGILMQLGEGDAHFLTGLRVPLADDPRDFDEQVLALSKIMIDSLNVALLRTLCGPEFSEAKSIELLKAFLDSRLGVEGTKLVDRLRDLQSIRSTGVAHRRGENYYKIVGRLGLAGRDRRQVISEFIKDCTEILDVIDRVRDVKVEDRQC